MATTVAFGSNLVVDEGSGNAYLVVNRTGDLSGTTLIEVREDWSRSSAEKEDIIFNPHVAGSGITYLSSSRSVLLSFAPGVKTLKIPYSISNDIVSETAERLYFSMLYVTPVTIGDGDANIKINASDPVLSIHGGLLVDEGDYSTSYLELSHAVNFDVIVEVSTYLGTYKQANYLGEAGDYKGLVDRLVAIPAGQTKAIVPIITYQNPDPNDWKYESTEIRIEASSLPVGVLLGQYSDIVTIADVAIPPPVVLPTLTLYDGGLAFEGGASGSYAELSDPVDHDVTFKVSTYFGTYQQANYLGEGGDYNGLIDELFVIKAGQKKVDIPVQIHQNPDPNDWAYEAFELRIEANTVSGATLDVGSVIISIKDVSTWVEPPPPTVTPLTATMLQNHKQAFLNLESEVGTSSAVTVIENDSFLSRVAKTLEGLGQLPLSFIQAGLSLTATIAYASEEELPRSELVDLVAGRVGSNYPFLTSIQLLEALAPKEWTSIDIAFVGDKYLRVGDYVDGRLVIHQPWMALDADGDYIKTNSVQGRYTPNDPSMFSHGGLYRHSMDWTAVNGDMYMVAPASGTIVDSEYLLSSAKDVFGPGNLGNFVTIQLDKVTLDGKPIFITYGHLAQENSQLFKDGDKVKVGQIVGMVGDTGGYLNDAGEFQHYVRHAHITSEIQTRDARGNDNLIGTVAGIVIDSEHKAEREATKEPPVYILGFNKGNTGSFSDLGITGEGGQDYGMPIGDFTASYGDNVDKLVAVNIYPNIPTSDFYIANPTFTLPSTNIVRGNSENNHFPGTPGDDLYLGEEGYDQVNYFGPASNRTNFTVTQNPDHTIKVSSTEFGTDTLNNVEGVWFDNQNKWYTIENLLIPVSTHFATPGDPVLEGTAAEDIFIGDDNINWFIGHGGGDTYHGSGEYDQVEYYGPDAYRSNFIFSKNLDGSVTVASPYGRETYTDIEGVWFGTEQAWYSVEALTFI